ncbi:AEC family transporter [Thioalkalivibrio denitrificans]|uniref:AEC family transporter n=1 Tax=Thioalkalivibrio denitrificans TaxID=108003 RepID=UPI001FE7694B|nr:AEC family transporter [Thioalkalivibrio denitrificans]
MPPVSVASLLVPTITLVLMGYLLRRYGGFSQSFWSDLERLIYYVLFPALLFGALASRPLQLDQASPMIYTGVTFIVLGIVLGYGARWWFGLSAISFASAFQCAFRFNGYIGFAVLGALYAQDGIAAFGLLTGFMVPLANVASVWALAHHGEGRMWREIIGNPLILSTFAGLVWSALGLPLPAMVDTTLEFLGYTALPMGLIAVGAGLRLVISGRQMGAVAYLTAIKLLALPAVAWWVGGMFGLRAEYLAAAVIMAALPTASSAYILTVRMGGDGPLVASIVAVNMIAAIVTLPIWLAVL